MSLPEGIRPTPWDEKAFGIPCYEISEPTTEALGHAATHPGHYTVKLEPLASKEALHRMGFYYVDTLIEPVCKRGKLRVVRHSDCSIRPLRDMEVLVPICRDSFRHGRFHRDFNLRNADADQRYIQWLHQLTNEGQVFGLYFIDDLAGFIACQGDSLRLHAMAASYRGRGLAKYFWSKACENLFACGHEQVRSSISAANLAALNLYCSLGFRFSHACDVYHRLTV